MGPGPKLASEPGNGVIAPCAHSDQYIDDADCSVAVSHDCDVSDVARRFCNRLQLLLRSEVDLLKSSMGEETGIMTGRIESRSLIGDEMFKLHCSLVLPLGSDDEPGLAALSAIPGVAAAFLSSQSTPLMAHTSTYLWLRCTVRSMFKAHRIWKEVKDLGYTTTGMIMNPKTRLFGYLDPLGLEVLGFYRAHRLFQP